jgi:hypothetical protein
MAKSSEHRQAEPSNAIAATDSGWRPKHLRNPRGWRRQEQSANPASFTGAADRERGLRDLRNLARAIDPHFREQIREISAQRRRHERNATRGPDETR